MVKKSSLLTSLLLGAAGGAAAAAFLATKTGKAVKDKVVGFAQNYKENHEEINADLVNKAQDLGKQASDKFSEVKTQLETGELTVEDLLKSGKEKSLETFEQLKEKLAEQNLSKAEILEAIRSKTVKAPTVTAQEDIEDAVLVSEDIEIDLTAVAAEPAAPVLPLADSEKA